MPRKRKEDATVEPGKGLHLDRELIKQLVPGTPDRASIESLIFRLILIKNCRPQSRLGRFDSGSRLQKKPRFGGAFLLCRRVCVSRVMPLRTQPRGATASRQPSTGCIGVSSLS
jgi:hypothetical protein